MKSLITVFALILISTAAFCQSSGQAQKSAVKQSSNASANTNKSSSSNTERAINPNNNGKTWYYCPLCGQKFTAAGKCPADGTTLIAKTIK